MNATYNGIPANHIAYSQELVISSGRKPSLSAIAWDYMKRCGADMIETTLNYDIKHNKSVKYDGSRRKAYWATFSRIAKAVWAWAKNMRKVAVTAAAMVMAKNSDAKTYDFDAAKPATPKERIEIAIRECNYGVKGIQRLISAEAKEMEGKPSVDEIIEALWRRYLQAKARYFSRDGYYTFSTYCNYRISKLA